MHWTEDWTLVNFLFPLRRVSFHCVVFPFTARVKKGKREAAKAQIKE